MDGERRGGGDGGNGGRTVRRALRIVLLLARLALAGVFLWAAWGKIAAPDAFALAVYRYRILPSWAVNAFAL